MFRLCVFAVWVLVFFGMTGEAVSKPYPPPVAHSFEKKIWGEPEKKEQVKEKNDFFPQKTEILSDRTVVVLPPWMENAVPAFETAEESPMIAIVIDDLGLNKELTYDALSLPAPITASFLAYADDLPEQTEFASENGHELLLHMPMEPLDPHYNSGPNTLKTTESEKRIKKKMEKMLNAFTGYVGINNHMGSKFTTNEKAVSAVMDELEKRGLLFLDSMTSGKSVAWKEAGKHHVPYAVRDVFLDNSRQESDILRQLRLLERRARKRHVAVAIGHPHKATIIALKKWMPEAQKRGIVFVPVSMVALVGQESF